LARLLGWLGVEPILHLSLPVRDLAESVEFYEKVLECDVGRVREDFVDVWFFGMQVTLESHWRSVRASRGRRRGIRCS
jgi:extradiol dioxygenase family protein